MCGSGAWWSALKDDRCEPPQALEVIRRHSFSSALFAPGWVYEALDKAEFRKNQDK